MMKPSLNIRAFLLASLLAALSAPVSAQRSAARTRLQTGHPLPQTAEGSEAMLQRLSSGERSAISLAAGDFFEDGRNGLVTGYSLGDGGVIAVQQGATLPRVEEASSVTPLAARTSFLDVGLRPDFLLAGNLTGGGHQDLVVAARGGSTLRVLAGDGRGNFQAQAPFAVEGRLLSVAIWRDAAGQPVIAAGVCGSGCSVALYKADGTRFARVPVSGEPAVLAAAKVNGGSADDLIAGNAAQLVVVDGRTLTAKSPRLQRLPVAGALAVATGSFVFDRRGGLPQIGVLTTDGSVHVLARTGLVPTPEVPAGVAPPGGRGHSVATGTEVDPSVLSWFDAETLPGIAAPDSGATPLLLRTRLSGSGMDDLLALNVNGGGTVSIGHPVVAATPEEGQPLQAAQVLPARVESEGSTGNRVMAALALRTGQDARLGLVTAEAAAQPTLAALSAYHTIYVTSTADSAVTPAQTSACQTYSSANTGCTLRAAMGVVNLDASYNEAHGTADTVNLPANTITLSYSSSGSGVDSNGNYNYHIEVDGPMNLIGQGAGSSVISANNQDKIFSINPGYTVAQAPMDIFLSNLTLANGTNKNSEFANISANAVGGLLDFDTYLSGNITFVNCNFSGGQALFGEGGGIFVSDNIVNNGATHGNGTLEVDGGTFSSNKSSERGGAISTATTETYGYVPIVINGVTFTGNAVDHSLSTSDTNTSGYGGAIDFVRDAQTGKTPTILNSTFSNNSTVLSAGHGYSEGGALFAGSGVTISNSIFTGNSAQTSGGAIEMATEDYSPNLSGLTVTGNSAPDSAGIELDAATAPGGLASTVQYNRISGNTNSTVAGSTTTTRSGLGVGAATQIDAEATVDARYNFWGCNGAATGTGCDTAAVDSSASSGTLTLTPYAAVTASLNSATPTAGSTLTLTGGIFTDSGGAALSNVNAFTGVVGGSSSTSSGATVTNPGGKVSAGLAIMENGGTLATLTTATDITAKAMLGVTVNAGGSGTGTVTIDNATATANFTVTVFQPTIAIAFGASTIPVNGTTTLTFTLTNPNTGVALNGVAFTDALPSGLLFSGSFLSNTCGGSLNIANGNTAVLFMGGTINPNLTCTMQINVMGTSAGAKVNTTGPVTAVNASTSPTSSNSATLTVLAPPLIGKAFGVPSIPSGGTTTLTFTLVNPTSTTQSGIAFTDTFPTGLTLASPTGLSGSCGGSVQAQPGGGSVVVTGVTLSGNANCTITVNVTDSTPGSVVNTTGTVSSTQGGTGLTASAQITVVGPPTIAESFSPMTVAPNVNSTVTFTLGNPSANTVTLSGVSFADTLPTGLRVATPSGAATTCSGGAVTAAAGGGSISLGGASIASGATCAVTVNVVSSAIGSYTNTTGTVTANGAGTGGTASATLTVTVTPTRLVYTAAPPTPITSGGNGGTVSVALEDAAGNVATNNSTAVVTLTVTGPGGYSQTLPSATASNGVASFNLSSVPLKVAGTYTYTATSAGLTQAQVTEIVNPGPAAAFSVIFPAMLTAPQMSGTATVTALDANGNTATGFTGTVTLSSTDSAATYSPSPYTFLAADMGTHTFTVTFNTAGTQTLTAASGGLTGADSGILVEDAIWVLNTNGTVARITDSGAQTTTAGTGSGTSIYGALAIDNAGDLWSVRTGSNTVQEYTRTGSTVTVAGSAGAGVNAPVSLFIDGAGQVWVANGNNSVSVLSSAGAAVTPSTGYQGGGINGGSGIVVDSSGSVWVSNRGNNSVTKIFGAAAPVATPLVTGTTNNTLGTKP